MNTDLHRWDGSKRLTVVPSSVFHLCESVAETQLLSHRETSLQTMKNLLLTLGLLAALTASAQVPQIINYQGRITVGGTNYDAAGSFKFALVNTAGTVNYWANDGTASGQPASGVSLAVSKGLYSVLLGDTTVSGMTTAIGSTVFANSDVRLRVWFSDGSGYQQLTPDQRIAAVGYALVAGTVSDGAITSAKLASGAIGATQLATGAVGATQLASGAVTSAKLGASAVGSSALDLTGLTTVLWKAGGNSGTTAGTHFLGTTDNVALELKANNLRAFRVEPTSSNAPNILLGAAQNSVASGVVGAVISGGGAGTYAGSAVTNLVQSDFGSIGGGGANGIKTGSLGARIGGGYLNLVTNGTYATIGGGYANAASTNSATVGGGFYNVASGFESTVGGGQANIASGSVSFVGGGVTNIASGFESAVVGGELNDATGAISFVGGGYFNAASAYGAVVGGGYANGAVGTNSIVAGGESNLASNSVATVSGGYFNGATGQGATVPGGWANLASGSNSFAAGFVANAGHNGAFVWSDSSSATTFGSTVANQFNVRAAGGTRIFSNAGATLGVQLDANATSWSALSDRNAKKDFAPVDGREVLRKLDGVAVQSWRYKWDEAGSTPHLGPIAQEFKAVFYPGRDDKSISTLEFDGVELAAIQGLHALVKEKDVRITALEQRLADIEAKVNKLVK